MKNRRLIWFATFGVVIILMIVSIWYKSTWFNLNGSPVKPVADQSTKISVVASFYPVYFFTQQIGGDKVMVYNLTPAGAEPHDFEPTPRDMARIEDSRLLVLNGGHLESWADDLKKNLNQSKTAIVIAGEDLTDQQIVTDDDVVIDPHVWLSPPLAKKMAVKIAQALIAVDQANIDYYQNNLEILQQRLDKLDENYQLGLSQCASQDIITAHSAFGYLAKAYGLRQESIAGLNPETEPSTHDLAVLAEFAKSHQIKYIFFESLVSPKLSQTLAQEINAQTLVLNPLEGLTDDQVNQGEDYFTVMYENLINLQTALTCKK
jgi:zinc transport system substrate-binding protein